MGVFVQNKFSDFLLVWALIVLIGGIIVGVGALKNMQQDLSKIARELEKRNFIHQPRALA